MAISRKPQVIYTLEEYFALEERVDYRSEFYRGEIFAMSGGSANHNRITGDLFATLHNSLSGQPCEPFVTDLRLLVKQKRLYTYPDVMVVCGPLQFAPRRTDTVTNPVIIFEVLSPSTDSYDRGKKFEFYRTIETLREYILIDQARVYVEHYRRRAHRQWVLTVLDDLEDVLALQSIDSAVVLEDIYQRVVWDE